MDSFSLPVHEHPPLKDYARLLDPLLTRVEAADYLGVKPSTLAQWASNGSSELTFIKVGRLVKYRVSDLQKFLDYRARTIA